MTTMKRFLTLLTVAGVTAALTYLIVANRFRHEQVDRLRAELARVEAERADLQRELDRANADRNTRPRPDSLALPPSVVFLRQTTAPPAQVESAGPSDPSAAAAPSDVLPGRVGPVALPSAVVPAPVPVWERFVGTTNSLCRIRGTSSRHDWALQSRVIGGFIELDPRLNPAWSGATAAQLLGNHLAAQAEAAVPVWSFTLDRSAGRAFFDEHAVRVSLNESAHPKIEYRLNELVLTPDATNAAGVFICQSRGVLVVAGVTNLVEVPVTLNLQRSLRLVISGSTALRMTDFGIEPPEFRYADTETTIRTGDAVTMSFEWILSHVAPASSRH